MNGQARYVGTPAAIHGVQENVSKHLLDLSLREVRRYRTYGSLEGKVGGCGIELFREK